MKNKMKIKELLEHFDNEEQIVDVAHPILARNITSIKELKNDEKYMNMEISSWKMNSKNVLEINC